MYTKFVATIGPACDSRETLAALIDAGMDIARFNFSHAKVDEVHARAKNIRELSQAKNKPIRILQDLCGRRIRIGDIASGSRDFREKEELTFYTLGAPNPTDQEIPINDTTLHNDVKPGSVILIESGKYRGTVTKVEPATHRIVVAMERNGTLLSRKGINVPNTMLTAPALTHKDVQDVELGKELNFEYVALSFVQTAADVQSLRALLHPTQKIISKVEDPIGVKNIDAIIDASDGIMVARGDLGVEMPLEEIPFIQKQLVAKCRYANKPSIVATQMLLSMVFNPTPTRAEVSDVANAVLDGTDAVMLSDETAMGDYPVEALETLVRITKRTEAFLYVRENRLI